MQIQLYGSGN